jgi:Mg/Co/Ni transporter MgtE
MEPARKPLDQNASALEATRAFCLGTAEYLWVTDASGNYLGAIGLDILKQFEDFPKLDAINAFMVFSIEGFPKVQQSDSLTLTLHALLKSEASCLPVVSNDGKLLGQISKNDVLMALS